MKLLNSFWFSPTFSYFRYFLFDIKYIDEIHHFISEFKRDQSLSQKSLAQLRLSQTALSVSYSDTESQLASLRLAESDLPPSTRASRANSSLTLSITSASRKLARIGSEYTALDKQATQISNLVQSNQDRLARVTRLVALGDERWVDLGMDRNGDRYFFWVVEMGCPGTLVNTDTCGWDEDTVMPVFGYVYIQYNGSILIQHVEHSFDLGNTNNLERYTRVH